MELSVVLPSYNPDKNFSKTTQDLVEYLRKSFQNFEIIIVDDGSREPISSDKKEVRVIRHEKNKGKGASVKTGVMSANGKVILFTDSDIPFDFAAIEFFYFQILSGFDVAIGDRSLPTSIFNREVPFLRRLASWIFTRFIFIFFTGKLPDTQCGLKAFSNEVGKELFKLQSLEGFSFDVEIIYLVVKYNISLKRLPVKLVRKGKSSVSLLRDGIKMTTSIFHIWFQEKRKRYESSFLLRRGSPIYWK